LTVVFLGTSGFADIVLERLLASPHVVTGVVSAPPRPSGRGGKGADPPAARRAEARGIPLLRPARWDDDAIAWVERRGAERLVVADYGKLIPVDRLPEALNVHPSLLPRWRGAAPVPRAILAGDEEIGVSVMRLVPEMDAGPVYGQRTIPAGREANAGTLLETLAREGAALLLDLLPEIQAGVAVARPQDERGVSFAPKLTPQEEWVSPEEVGVEDFIRRVRALSPSPSLKIRFQESALAVLKARPTDEDAGVAPGQIEAVGGRPVLGLGHGQAELVEVRPAGRRPMAGDAFVNGYLQRRGS